MEQARLRKLYDEKIRLELQSVLGLKNIMQIPRISKIVLNVGVKEAVTDSKALIEVEQALGLIAGQQPVRTKAKKSIAGFKIREDMLIGVKVTLRRRLMYEFLDRLINVAIPKTRDFQGVSIKFDQRGNYNLGIKEWNIFPEIASEAMAKTRGLNVTIETTTDNDEHACELLKRFGMPFIKVLNKNI
jgi:large subunit ribosomal protein L5